MIFEVKFIEFHSITLRNIFAKKLYKVPYLGIYITISTNMSVCPSSRPSRNFVLLKSPWNHPQPPGLTMPGEHGQAFARKRLRIGHFLVFITIQD